MTIEQRIEEIEDKHWWTHQGQFHQEGGGYCGKCWLLTELKAALEREKELADLVREAIPEIDSGAARAIDRTRKWLERAKGAVGK